MTSPMQSPMTTNLTITQPRAVLDDPHACTDSSDVLSVFSALFEGLVRRSDAGYQPALATHWSMSEDARTSSFTLRDGVRFHDGERCDAEAVKHCLERMARPDMGATLGAPGVYAQYLAGMTIEIVDGRRLKLTTVEPLADILDILHVGHIVSPRALAAAGDDLAKRAVGTGPYRLERWRDGEEVGVSANMAYHGRRPAFATINWRRGASAAERLSLLRDGHAQVANGLDHGQAAVLDRQRFTTLDYLSPVALILMFNAARGPGADPRVRRALNLGIDRMGLVRDVLGGAGQPLHGYVSPVHDGADPDAPGFAHDLAMAGQLLREAGYGTGLELNLYCPTRLPDEAQMLAAALERQLAPIGVSFRIHLEPDRVHYANQVRLKQIHDICVFDSSPMSCFRVLHEKVDSRVRGSWWEGYANPEAEALMDRARRTVDEGPRRAIQRQIYRLLQADPPWLYVYNHRRMVGLAGRHPAFVMPRDGVLNVRALAPPSEPA
jgi:peptide/nickel transport system substrate-binding protein